MVLSLPVELEDDAYEYLSIVFTNARGRWGVDCQFDGHRCSGKRDNKQAGNLKFALDS
jgi:hypothetical protein